MRRVAFLGLALALLAGAALVWGAFERDVARAKARITGRSDVLESPYGAIEVAIRGEGAPLLVLHGSGGGFDQGLDVLGPLSERGFQVIAPSRFGYLRSDRPANASPELQSDALLWLLDELGLDKVVVAGVSAGAVSAIQLALRSPDRVEALVLLVPAAYAPDRAPRESAMDGPLARALFLGLLKSDFLFWAADKLAPNAVTRALLATEPALLAKASAAERQRVAEMRAHVLPVSRRARGILDDNAWSGLPAPYAPSEFAAPVLAISFRDDLFGTYAAARFAAENAPNGRLLGFETGGHMMVGHREQVMDAVAAFASGARQERAEATAP